MIANPDDPLPALAEQVRLQIRMNARRATWWIPWIFVIGLAVSILGLITAAMMSRDTGRALPVAVLAVPTLGFGWAVALWLLGPLLIRPRIVPCLARELGPMGGETMAAFKRGRALFRHASALERLAIARGVDPLSAFGFHDEHYDQDVRWRSAADGQRTVDALRASLDGELAADAEVARDLEALASVLRTAAERGVDFSLAVRLHATESLQAVCTSESRSGSFW